ncbi:lysine N(6)-hydroxylase/L-ornithine N(5)-oxygenase family protein [Cysteiniphilum sp. JM-1]|uniref:lysine N(6)-hydroxylase/L-ornithine N(5)-oxygenase family protein n=1 Tax=Cysteiniphilum sp. JM-1 TaxID=2610891 RepID=UPI001248BD04|nr:SidA/IucD/PvdA family monooxygenase [Cysteiniphilum sp. JM-1]
MMQHYDVIGVGIGPFNLSLAALLADKSLKCMFVDKKAEFNWHAGVMMPTTTLQVPFMADLVTMADPTNRFSFLNYLKAQGLLYPFFFKESFFMLRKEYNEYCRWVIAQLSSCHFAMEAVRIKTLKQQNKYVWQVAIKDANGFVKQLTAENVVFGVGSVPQLPHALRDASQRIKENIHHSAQYLDIKDSLLSKKHITLIGSGQSAAEIFLDLMSTKHISTKLTWITRSKSFFPMEHTPLALEHFSPDYIDYFYDLSKEKKTKLVTKQGLLHKGISGETLKEIYTLLYQRKIYGDHSFEVISNSELVDVEPCYSSEQQQILRCHYHQRDQAQSFKVETDHVIAATGYEDNLSRWLKTVADDFALDDSGNYLIDKNYQLQHAHVHELRAFVQNAEMHSHGVGAPDLTLGAYRSALIANQLLGYKHYQFASQHGLTHFGVPTRYLKEQENAQESAQKEVKQGEEAIAEML